MNRTLMEKERRILSGVSMAQELWAEAVDMACYSINRLSSMALVNETLYEVWADKNPSLSHLRVFGCEAFVHVPREKRSKLDSKSEKSIIIGYKDGVKGYKLWNHVTRKIVHSRDVIFKEVRGTSKVEDVKREKELENLEFELNDEGRDSD